MTMQADTPRSATLRDRISFRWSWWLVVSAATVLYAILLSAQAIYEHETFRSTFDVAVYDQRLWLLAHGQNPFSTVVSKPFLGDHFEPGLALLTPIYWLGLGVPGILVAQTIGLALVAPALFALARAAGATPGVSSIPALLWLASPATATANLFGFRPAAFASVLIVLSVLAAIQDRYVLLAATMLLAFTLKEDIPATYFVLGVLLVCYGKRRLGTVLAVFSAAFAVTSGRVIHGLSDQYEWQVRRFAGGRGDSMGEVLLYFVHHPLDTVGDAGANGGVPVLVLALSTGGLALLAPLWMLLAAPTAAFNALSAYESQHNLVLHYHLLVATGFFIAAAIGVPRLQSCGRTARAIATAGVAAALGIALVGGKAIHDIAPSLTGDQRAEIRLALELIPPGAPVSASPDLLPHLSQRVDVYTFPEPFIQIDWGSSLTREELTERAQRVRFVALGEQEPVEYSGGFSAVRQTLTTEGWAVIARAGPIEILERR